MDGDALRGRSVGVVGAGIGGLSAAAYLAAAGAEVTCTSALGLAHTMRQTGPLRPGPRVRGTDRLYYVGASSNPGIGVPMYLLGGEHCAAAVEADDVDGPFDRLPLVRQ